MKDRLVEMMSACFRMADNRNNKLDDDQRLLIEAAGLLIEESFCSPRCKDLLAAAKMISEGDRD